MNKDNKESAIDIYCSVMASLTRPRTTFWNPYGWTNTFYLDTQTWARTPSKELMRQVNDEFGKLDK